MWTTVSRTVHCNEPANKPLQSLEAPGEIASKTRSPARSRSSGERNSATKRFLHSRRATVGEYLGSERLALDAHASVDLFTKQVGVPTVAGSLLDHMHQHLAYRVVIRHSSVLSATKARRALTVRAGHHRSERYGASSRLLAIQPGESTRTGDAPTRVARSDSKRSSCLAPIFRLHLSRNSSKMASPTRMTSKPSAVT